MRGPERRASRRPPVRPAATVDVAWRGLEAGGLVSFKDFLRFQEWAQRQMLTEAEAEDVIERLIEERWRQRVAKRREQFTRRQTGQCDEAAVILLFGPELRGAV